ncbi:MAG: cytochrome C oxidase Cbb3, partial [Pseudomonadota bacterium]
DPIWLYGGDKASLVAQLRVPQHGAMPPWADYFDEATVKKLAVYVHSLGGGEREIAADAPATVIVPAEPGANQ